MQTIAVMKNIPYFLPVVYMPTGLRYCDGCWCPGNKRGQAFISYHPGLTATRVLHEIVISIIQTISERGRQVVNPPVSLLFVYRWIRVLIVIYLWQQWYTLYVFLYSYVVNSLISLSLNVCINILRTWMFSGSRTGCLSQYIQVQYTPQLKDVSFC